MKRFAILSLLMTLTLAACSNHYIRVEKEQTHLFLKARHAQSVMFASSLDHFQWRNADRINGQTWQITIPRDIPQTYIYLVDHQIFLPDCRFKEQDDFGSRNCLYIPGM
jgi:hypothetical protein